MADSVLTHTFSYHQILTALLKEADIHEGIWGVHTEFNMGAGNLPGPKGPDTLVPTVALAIMRIGIRQYESEGPLSVDAAKVNPLKPKKRKLV